jgi:hypothetical protein
MLANLFETEQKRAVSTGELLIFSSACAENLALRSCKEKLPLGSTETHFVYSTFRFSHHHQETQSKMDA